MTEETEELLTGRAGEEARQGFEPMPMANPDPPSEPAFDTDSALAKHLQRPAPPEPIERTYSDAQSGQPTPDNQTVELDRASRDLTAIREAERLEIDRARNEALNRELDDATQTLDVLRAAETPHVDVSGPEQQPQPQEPDYTPQVEAENLPPPQVDPEVLAAFQNPKVRAVLEQVDLGIQQTQSAYQNQLANAALTGVAAFAAAFPELNGIPAEQLVGAVSLIAKTNPARAQEIARQYDRVAHLVVQNQQVAQQAAQQRAHVQAEQFRQFAQASDDRFYAAYKDMPKEQFSAIREEAKNMLREYGLSDADLAREWNSNPLFRSAAGQQIMAEAAAHRLARKSIARAASRPAVPNVQRPGISEPVRIDDGAVASALARLNAPGGAEGRVGLKNAAALVAARRGGR